jgi:hypothetical protein
VCCHDSHDMTGVSPSPRPHTTSLQGAEPDSEADLFQNYGSAEQRLRMWQQWNEEEQKRAAAHDRLPPNPLAVPLAGDKLTERLLRLAQACSRDMASDRARHKALRREQRRRG